MANQPTSTPPRVKVDYLLAAIGILIVLASGAFCLAALWHMFRPMEFAVILCLLAGVSCFGHD